MTAPTTRETADHAELARLAEAEQSWSLGIYKNRDQADDAAKFNNLDIPATVLALLSEIAALRGEHKLTLQDGSEAWCSSAAWRWFQEWAVRLEQAERQRDELLSFVRKLDCECDPSFSTASCGRCVQLANQGADQ